MSQILKRAACTGFAVLMFAAAGLAAAQGPATAPTTADLARDQQAQQQKQPLNNQPLWKEVRSGAPQTSTVQGRETNVLIQSQGQTWRAVRVPVATLLGGLIAFQIVALFGYYLWRGTIELQGKPTGRLIERFSAARRFAHWSLALTFMTLGVTGMIMTFGKSILLPVIGYTLFSWLATIAKNLHNFTGPIFSVTVPIFVVMYFKDNLPGAHDVQWFLKLGGMLDRSGNTHLPSGKFNAGEKGQYWSVAVLVSSVLVVTGYILDFPNFDQTRQTMQIANIIHMIAGLVGISMVILHLYMGTVGMRGAYEAMRYGYVDETWAKEHHELWYNDVMAGKVARGQEPAAPVPQGRPA